MNRDSFFEYSGQKEFAKNKVAQHNANKQNGKNIHADPHCRANISNKLHQYKKKWICNKYSRDCTLLFRMNRAKICTDGNNMEKKKPNSI